MHVISFLACKAATKKKKEKTAFEYQKKWIFINQVAYVYAEINIFLVDLAKKEETSRRGIKNFRSDEFINKIKFNT